MGMAREDDNIAIVLLIIHRCYELEGRDSVNDYTQNAVKISINDVVSTSDVLVAWEKVRKSAGSLVAPWFRELMMTRGETGHAEVREVPLLCLWRSCGLISGEVTNDLFESMLCLSNINTTDIKLRALLAAFLTNCATLVPGREAAASRALLGIAMSLIVGAHRYHESVLGSESSSYWATIFAKHDISNRRLHSSLCEAEIAIKGVGTMLSRNKL